MAGFLHFGRRFFNMGEAAGARKRLKEQGETKALSSPFALLFLPMAPATAPNSSLPYPLRVKQGKVVVSRPHAP
jgi:hypothetical protein